MLPGNKNQQPMPDHKSCPLCKSDNIEEVFKATDYLVSGQEFPLIKCSDCFFIFTNEYPPENQAANYYISGDYISHSDTSKGTINKIYHLVRGYMLKRKFSMLRRVSPAGKQSVLDIGCGTAYFPLYLNQKGWHCKGLEISDEARKFAYEKHGLTIDKPEKIVDFELGSFDIVTMWHTLEHFYDPDNYMKNVHRLLRKNGLLVIALPNNSSYDAGYYSKYWAAWDVPRHLWHFDPHTIERYAGGHGFAPVKTFRLPFDAFYVSVLSEKHKGSGTAVIKGFFRGFISWFTALTRQSRTSSLVYIFRKNQ